MYTYIHVYGGRHNSSMWTKEGINNDDSNNYGKHKHGVRTDKEIGGKDGKNTFE